jgi:hypothetical protein
MKLNRLTRLLGPLTHEGAPAFAQLNPEQKLRRSLMSCLLWEGEFYEDGRTIAERIAEQAMLIAPERLAEIAIEAREVGKLRHAPLLLAAVLTKTGAGKPGLVSARSRAWSSAPTSWPSSWQSTGRAASGRCRRRPRRASPARSPSSTPTSSPSTTATRP